MPLLRQKVVTSSFAEVTLKTFWQLAQREGSLFFKNYAKENSGNRIHKYFPFRRSADVLRCASKQTLDLSNNRNWNIISEEKSVWNVGTASLCIPGFSLIRLAYVRCYFKRSFCEVKRWLLAIQQIPFSTRTSRNLRTANETLKAATWKGR